VEVAGDRTHLELLTGELLRVARESLASRDDAVVLRLHADRERGEAVLSVRDEGGGFAPETIAALERPFGQGAGTGADLGLAIAAWIVQQHRGSLAVESTLGEGTTVTVRVPLAPGAPGASG
jgi:two-component system phosphate regulon sensor histidine kinase PhoR